MAIDWGGSYSATLRVMEVDPATWEDVRELPGVVGASVERSTGREMLESGSVSFEVGSDDPIGECWARIELLAEQDGEHERHAVATMRLVPSPSKARRGMVMADMDARSVLYPADAGKLRAGHTVPAGADGAAWAAAMLSERMDAPVAAEGSFRLGEPVVFEGGTSLLEAAWQVLDAAGWCIQVSGDGSVAVRAKPSEPSLVIDVDGSRLLSTEVEVDDGLADVPNRYIAVDGDEEAVAEDADPASPTSTVARGMVIEEHDSSPKRIDGESLQAYAQRRLAERSSTVGRRTYTRAWVPGVGLYDVVRGSLGEARLTGDMRVASQSLAIGAGIDVSETVEVVR